MGKVLKMLKMKTVQGVQREQGREMDTGKKETYEMGGEVVSSDS